jgi:transglutaminase-like putative cysteine protease
VTLLVVRPAALALAAAAAVLAGSGTGGPPSRATAGGEAAARRVVLTYALRVEPPPGGARRAVAWLPLPADSGPQTLHGWRLREPWPVEVVADQTYGNRFLRVRLERAPGAGGSALELTADFTVSRRPFSAWSEPAIALRGEDLGRYLRPDRLVPTACVVAAEAWRVAGPVADPLARARRLYAHIVDTLAYDKSGTGWGRGDAVYACEVRRGNCTDFHSLFVGEARALGIPARFVMGVPLPPAGAEARIPGYHCWAEFHLAGRGWIPIDASAAHRRPSARDFYFGSLDADRVALTVGRDLDLPGAARRGLNFVAGPHVELDGAAPGAVATDLHVRDEAL